MANITSERERELVRAMTYNLNSMELLSWEYHDGGEPEFEDGEQEYMEENYEVVITLVKK